MLEETSAAFKALGHPHRLAIVRRLLRAGLTHRAEGRLGEGQLEPGGCCVGELGKGLEIAPSTLSHHLKELDRAGLIDRGREGRYLYCRLNADRLDELRAFLGGEHEGERP